MYCEKYDKGYANERVSALSRGYNSRWRIARDRYLKANPLFVKCKVQGKMSKATVVDHIKPHRGVKVLFWEESNWQSLCKCCHDS